jgi:uncharacterized peroxidase-related enzyme
MSWIDTVPYEEAEGKLKRLYERVKGPDDNVDNIMMAHSLRPHTMEGHMVLYKNVLHHSANEVPKWFLECLGVYVSQLNRCRYCVEHHFEGLSRLLDDESRSAAILEALESERFEGAFTEKEEAAFHYARIVTLVPHAMQVGDFGQMTDLGWSDGEILEINQVVAYFNYANRMVLGLGITTEGDNLGLSPGDSENPDNWQHA